MTSLQNLALSLLSFLLFLSLSIFASAFMLDKTLLNPDFVTSELNRLDVSSLVGELLSEQIPQEEPYIADALGKTIVDLEPWAKEEISTIIHSGYDYLLGKEESLNLIISTEPAQNTLKENFTEAILDSPPPELKGRPSTEIRQHADQAYQQYAEIIPSSFEFTESSIPPDVMDTLRQVRSYLSYYQTVYYGLIGFMLLLVLGIIFISRQVRDITRRLGIPCLTYGAFGYAGIFIARYFTKTGLPLPELPAALQTWLPQFLDNLMAPLETFSLGLLIGGVVLVIVSFVYKPRQPQPEC